MQAKVAIGIIVLLLLAGGLVLFGEKVNAPAEEGLSRDVTNTMELTSSAFEQERNIPAKYTCDGVNTNPPLEISGVPQEAMSLVLIMDDPDAVKPAGRVWDHWVVWNIPPKTSVIAEGEEPDGVHGTGTGDNTNYSGPCPPDAEHRYFFKLFALDTMLDLAAGATKADVEKAMEGHVLEQAELVGRYERTQ